MIIRAIKNIEPGEEINYDYGTDYFKAYLKPIGCKCDACEGKRKKKRAEARAERLRLKEKAERKAKKKAEMLARARKELKEKARRNASSKAGAKGAKANGKSLNGHGGKLRAARSTISLRARSKRGREQHASAGASA